MPEPTSLLAAEAFAALPGYVRDADAEGHLRRFVGALADQVAACDDLLQLRADPMDPATCRPELLPLAAALAGVDLTGIPVAAYRAAIADPVMVARGSVAAIVARVGWTLTGARTVVVTEGFGGDPMALRVVTYVGETPDASATEAAARRTAPAWLTVTHDVLTGVDYAELGSRYATYGDLTATGTTYAELAALT